MRKYRINVAGNAPYEYPTETLFGLLFCENGEVIEIPQNYPFIGEWGQTTEIQIRNYDEFSFPCKLELVWLSICEKKFYELTMNLQSTSLEAIWNVINPGLGDPMYNSIIVGMAPEGYVALWFYGADKSTIVGWFKAIETTVSMELFIPNHAELSVEKYCDAYMESLEDFQESEVSLTEFKNRMKQFIYRYQIIFENWDEDEETWIKYDEEKDEVFPEFEYIEESLYDGTHDKLHDGGLMKYHGAGKPKKLALKWHVKKSDYSAYFWFEDEEICAIFNKFYGQHPDTKTDFIIHIDPIKKKYELSLYRYGLKEPVIIQESAYQLIVFKSGFENCRSENYNQPTGAWIW